ncbi:MAG: FAD-dependent oxidoreductase [Candidatus Eremiobacteraeota bacterium]|nr:FAD-dependent oxidoreductase [Candidatus Eremiobacteraeota bacterium]MBV9263325.1 FAD-dependent oxidoreductase [Candidatus Eremiobacteraeota bacterium]
MNQPQSVTTGVCITGGGPCGVMLGVLLARAGVDVIVLEKYPDFFRDFRGDTVHPSTLELLYELGWLDDFLALRHDEFQTATANIAGEAIEVADLSHLRTHCKFVALMPQWDFLNFLAQHGHQYPTFHLRMATEGVGLLSSGGRVTGVRAKCAGEEIEISAKLVIGADGRHSTIRSAAGFAVKDLGAPMDILWMRISKNPTDPRMQLGWVRTGHMVILLDRGDYWQCAYLIPKGSFAALQAEGIDALRRGLAQTVPMLSDRVAQLEWSKVSMLDVRVDRLDVWHKPGLLCIGDAAHAMSPIGGIGINLAVQDAVATANILAETLRAGNAPSEAELQRVQSRRIFPTKVTQAFQTFVQDRAIAPLMAGAPVTNPPLAARLFDEFPWLRRLPASLIGVGVRPEHVRTPDVFVAAAGG